MKILSISSGLVSVPNEPDKERNKEPPQALDKYLILKWKCDTCKNNSVKLFKSKPTYSEEDIKAVAKATFNLAFYECGCNEEAKST